MGDQAVFTMSSVGMGDVGALLTLFRIADFRLPMANCLKTKEQDHGLLTADYGTTSLPIADWRLQM